MNKHTLIVTLAQDLKIRTDEARCILGSIADIITEAMSDSGEAEVAHIGTFTYNHATGEIGFSPSKSISANTRKATNARNSTKA